MIIKKYRGKDLVSLERTISEELGPDAIFLMIRTIDKGLILSYLGEEEFEITAGVDPIDLKKHNPAYSDGKEIGLNPIISGGNTKINCAGSIIPQSNKVNIIAVVGMNGRAVSASCIQLAHYFYKESPYRAALVCLKELYDNFPKEFDTMAGEHNFPYDIVLDRFSLIDTIRKHAEYDFIILRIPESMHPTRIKLLLQGIDPLWIQVVLSSNENLNPYKILHPQGIICDELNITDIPELVNPLGIPLSFLMNNGKFQPADSDKIEEMIINARLKS